MMLWFFGYKMGWFPIGKFLYPEKWYDAPFDSDVIFSMMIKFVVVVSLLQFAAYTATRGIEALSSRRNVRFASLIAIFIGSYFYWNTGEALARKPQQQLSTRITTHELNILFREIWTKKPPHPFRGRRAKLKYVTQYDIYPPSSRIKGAY